MHEPVHRDDTDDTKLVPSKTHAEHVMLIGADPRVVRCGDSYGMEPGVLHETFVAEPTVTLMRKEKPTRITPRVLVPVGREPDNAFDRETHDPDLLRAILHDALTGLTLDGEGL